MSLIHLFQVVLYLWWLPLVLQQLLKVTDADHPDYFLLETALDKLVNFLDQLNDSIENSMQIVNLEAEPKPKR